MNNRRGPGFSGGGLGFGGPRGPMGRGPGGPGFGGPRGPMGRGPGGPGFGPMGPGRMSIFGWNQGYRRRNTGCLGCMGAFILGLVIFGVSVYGVIELSGYIISMIFL